MKKADKSTGTNKTFDQVISKLSINGILNIQAMSYVRGGSTDGEAGGGSPVIIIPKPPQS
jgi:hypothetical protein